MAEADGKLTGRPGIAFVTRGPGACHASVGLHIAYQDSTPMILFVGDIDRNSRDREAFQEIDFKMFFRPLSKWVAEINDPDRLPEYINRAFSTSTHNFKKYTISLKLIISEKNTPRQFFRIPQILVLP